jgi:hypothetical protein
MYASQALSPGKGRQQRRLYIEAVTVCVEYSDFLAYTVLLNKPAFDRWVIVTTPGDEATRRLCEYHDLEYVVSNRFYEPEGWQPSTHGKGQLYKPPFAKAKGINDGLKALEQKGWVLHLDADIALSPRARDMIELAALREDSIYGIDRLMAKSFEQWAAHLTCPELQHDSNIFVRGNTFPFNVRVATHRDEHGGWLPIGFFQLWHPGVSGMSDYPEQHGTAGRTDMQHAQRWPRERRGLIPELIGIHLESEEAHMSANWEGRRTRYFGPAGMERHVVQHAKKEWL